MTEQRKLSQITGVYIDEITAATPPYDEPGVIQEFVGRGITSEYFLQPAQDVTGGTVEDFLERAKETIDIRGDRFKLQYKLLVRARTSRSASAKGRVYVRAVNPFSANVNRVRRVQETTRHSDIVENIDPTSKFYDVTIEMSK